MEMWTELHILIAGSRIKLAKLFNKHALEIDPYKGWDSIKICRVKQKDGQHNKIRCLN